MHDIVGYIDTVLHDREEHESNMHDTQRNNHIYSTMKRGRQEKVHMHAYIPYTRIYTVYRYMFCVSYGTLHAFSSVYRILYAVHVAIYIHVYIFSACVWYVNVIRSLLIAARTYICMHMRCVYTMYRELYSLYKRIQQRSIYTQY